MAAQLMPPLLAIIASVDLLLLVAAGHDGRAAHASNVGDVEMLVIMAAQPVYAKMEMLVAAVRVGRGARVVHNGDHVAPSSDAVDRCDDVVTQLYYDLVRQVIVAEPLRDGDGIISILIMAVLLFTNFVIISKCNTLGTTCISALHSGSLAVTVSRNRSVGSLVNTWCHKIGVDAFAHQPSLKGATLSQATQAVWATRPAASGCGVDAFVHHWFSTNHR
ncbi:hypothetical protein PHYSODRAFT_307379 [Phytophthora sojae]|uniref:Secreted protein n=1 Tax=Phytophthora sojae (strain P6497) TaxID=1094619 RepID=G5AE65_PHYSP|nr:hypothetical protein PHYSODRAFT_307379 [Phytophthora sojae]EGZ06467.1 hypothetical protein PHYSODRAFT_307379 [Phytophthora sojae]|eukprot:XP_009538364.1 hypothetical protein PHYSODRAFT_307379 [Phytophthora sojae]